MILIASVVIENEQIDGAQTLFSEAKKEGKPQEEDRGVDDHSGYMLSQKLIGFYREESILFVIFFCKS